MTEPNAEPVFDVTLPPGQRLIEGFPRFGGHLSRPAPAVPNDPVIEIRGAVTEGFDVPLSMLATLPRRELTADFHCVAGWSATNLRWEGVSFETVYRTFIETALPPETSVSHVVFRGLDGWRSVVSIDDALDPDVLIAERLDGRPLDSDHGAPARLVSPNQYGYVSTKHLCRIEVQTAEPKGTHGSCSEDCRCGCSAPIREPGSGRRSATATSPPGRCDASTEPPSPLPRISAPGAASRLAQPTAATVIGS